MKILAAIVTFNRRDLLTRCLDFVTTQTRPVDEIVVINNGSTDGTLDMLIERKISVITQENIGSAGGWNCAIQYALDYNFDAVWLMDDDGFPDTRSLDTLERALTPNVACASSIVVREDRPDYFVFPFPILDKNSLPKLCALPRKIGTVNELLLRSPGRTYSFAHLFNGALVSCAAVRRVGNVNKDFFIFGDEVDFFFRLRSAGRVVSVLDARHFHPDVSRRPYTPIKVYYYIKNTLILNSRYFNAVWLRNFIALIAVLARTAHRNSIREALSYLVGSRAPLFYQAIVRGLQGRIGKDFNG